MPFPIAVATGGTQALRPPPPPMRQEVLNAGGRPAGLPKEGGVYGARAGCEKCVERCRAAGGVWVKMRRGEPPLGPGGANPRANPFAVMASQRRDVVVAAVGRMLRGEPWVEVARQLGIVATSLLAVM